MRHMVRARTVPRASRWGPCCATFAVATLRLTPLRTAPNGCGQGAGMVIVVGALTGNSNCRRPADLSRADREF